MIDIIIVLNQYTIYQSISILLNIKYVQNREERLKRIGNSKAQINEEVNFTKVNIFYSLFIV